MAEQIYNLFNDIGSQMKDITIDLFISENDFYEDQTWALKLPHIAVSTPERALDLVSTGYLRCENIKIACFDDAEQLFGMSFFRNTNEIIKYINLDTQLSFSSAKFSQSFYDLLNTSFPGIVKIAAKNEKTLEGIKQFYINVVLRDKQQIPSTY